MDKTGQQLKYEWQFLQDSSERIDRFIADQEKDWSRTQIQQWIKEGRVLVNDQVIKSNYKCKQQDDIVLFIPPPLELEIAPEPIALDIFYEDQDVIVINKPRGMVVHPSPGHYHGTLVNGLLAHCQDLSGINGILRPGIVHRIDKDTSGLLMVAKNDRSHLALSAQLKAHTVDRRYLALVHGVIPNQQGTIDAPIGRDPADRQKMSIQFKNSREAVTHFSVIERFHNYSFIELVLETGRTHQIRVHMKYIGHPVAADPKYGVKDTLSIEGQALHAAVLGFIHPRTEQKMIFEAPLPQDMLLQLNKLRSETSE